MQDETFPPEVEDAYICPECQRTYTAIEAGRLDFLCCSEECLDRRVIMESLDAPDDSDVMEEQDEPEETDDYSGSGMASAEDDLDEYKSEPETYPGGVEDEQEEVTEEIPEQKPQAEYFCSGCDKTYTAAQADMVGSFCSALSCKDQMILLERIPGTASDSVEIARDEIGLGILMCDVSGSMENFAFSGRRSTKLSVVAGSVARGIWDLVEEMVEAAKKNAYVALIYFSKDAAFTADKNGEPFIKNIYEIGELFTSARDFGDFILKGMLKANSRIPQNILSDLVLGRDNTKHYTNINSALDLAYKLKEACVSGDLSEYGLRARMKVIEDVCISPDGGSVSVPNIRCLIYSDGSHNYPKDSEIKNPFDDDETSVLLTTFIGRELSKGSRQMAEMAGRCPKHGEPSFFTVYDSEGYQKLRGLFRMSSGVSGFCPSCLPRDY